MKKITILTTVSFLVCTAMASQKTQLAARYLQWDAAYKLSDASTMAALLANDFRLVTGSGKVISRANFVKTLGKGSKPTVYKTTLLKVIQRKGGAYAWTEEISQMPGNDLHNHRYRDFWVQRRGHWFLKESRTLIEK